MEGYVLQKKHLILRDINKNNFERVFASIYAFRSVVDVIDMVIADKIAKKASSKWEDVKVSAPEGDITLKIQVEKKQKHKPLADIWAALDDIHLSAAIQKDLAFIDILKLRYANYMGFILGIINNDHIIYETE